MNNMIIYLVYILGIYSVYIPCKCAIINNTIGLGLVTICLIINIICVINYIITVFIF